MAQSSYSQDLHIIPCLAPVDTTNVTAASDVIHAGWCQHVQFLVYFGAIDVAGVFNVYSADDAVPTTSTALAVYHYRYSAVTGTDTMGAVTASAAVNLATAGNEDGRILVVDIDPAGLLAGREYVWVEWNPTAGANNLICMIALVTPRYSENVVRSLVA